MLEGNQREAYRHTAYLIAATYAAMGAKVDVADIYRSVCPYGEPDKPKATYDKEDVKAFGNKMRELMG